VLLAAVACVAVLALGAGSAQALLVHKASFGSPGMAGGQFNSPQGVAVDQATGDVYVVDSGNFRVEKFDSSGKFLLAFGQGVDATTPGNVCPSTDTCQQATRVTTAGSPPGFDQPLFVAVDNSAGPSAGDVYVGDRGDDTVTKFNSNGQLDTSWPSPGGGGQLNSAGSFGSIDGITVDNSGNLLVINDGNPVFEFKQDGTPITNFSTGSRGMSPLGMDVDAAANIFKINVTGASRSSPARAGTPAR
jgi:tripartite motif-containing protein 71